MEFIIQLIWLLEDTTFTSRVLDSQNCHNPSLLLFTLHQWTAGIILEVGTESHYSQTLFLDAYTKGAKWGPFFC